MILNDKIALVTGGSRGIGRAVAQLLAEQGATVIATGRDAARVDAWVAETPSVEGRVRGLSLDVSNREQAPQALDALVEEHGRLDILVNNAGITRDGLVMSMEDDQFDEVLETNLTAAFRLCRAAVRHMVRARSGRIINITSVSGLAGNAGQANYAAAKAGLVGLTKTIAKEVAKRGITCNAVAPGFIETDMTAALPEKIQEQVKTLIPMQRMGSSAEIAGAVAFLAGPAATYVTGQVLVVDGGMFM